VSRALAILRTQAAELCESYEMLSNVTYKLQAGMVMRAEIIDNERLVLYAAATN